MLKHYHLRIISQQNYSCKRINVVSKNSFSRIIDSNALKIYGTNTNSNQYWSRIVIFTVLIRQQWYYLLWNISRPIKPNVIEVHLTRTARDSLVAFVTQSDGNPVNIG